MTGVDPYARALEAYELAYERVCQAREEWERAGRPLVIEHRNRMVGASPLLRVLQQAERDAARALEVIRLRHAGPDPVARVRASIGESPAHKLRRVK
jgi:hypothetical protein